MACRNIHNILRVLALVSILWLNPCLGSPTYSFVDLGATQGYSYTFMPDGQINYSLVGPDDGIRLHDGSYSISRRHISTPSGQYLGPYRAFATLAGQSPVEVLPPPGIIDETFLSAVNNKGMFVGWASNVPTGASSGLSQAISFTLAGGTSLVATPNNHGHAAAFSINDFGLIVGTSGNRAFLTDGALSRDLNTLIGPGSHFLLTSAMDINNSGQILSVALDTADHSQHVLLLSQSSVPEPSAFLLLSAGCLTTYCKSRWKKKRPQ